jgi:hypothetical protein
MHSGPELIELLTRRLSSGGLQIPTVSISFEDTKRESFVAILSQVLLYDSGAAQIMV